MVRVWNKDLIKYVETREELEAFCNQNPCPLPVRSGSPHYDFALDPKKRKTYKKTAQKQEHLACLFGTHKPVWLVIVKNDNNKKEEEEEESPALIEMCSYNGCIESIGYQCSECNLQYCSKVCHDKDAFCFM